MPRIQEKLTIPMGKYSLLNYFAAASQYTEERNDGTHPCFTCGENDAAPEDLNVVVTGQDQDLYLLICDSCYETMFNIDTDLDPLAAMRLLHGIPTGALLEGSTNTDQLHFPGELIN